MPLAALGLLSAQTARSMPLSATARACPTWSWLFARTGSEAAISEKPIMSAERISKVSMAIGSAIPRWHRIDLLRLE
jgi:hypothetical protein